MKQRVITMFLVQFSNVYLELLFQWFFYFPVHMVCIHFISNKDYSLCIGQQKLSSDILTGWRVVAKCLVFGKFRPGCLFFWLFIKRRVFQWYDLQCPPLG